MLELQNKIVCHLPGVAAPRVLMFTIKRSETVLSKHTHTHTQIYIHAKVIVRRNICGCYRLVNTE